MPGSEPLPSPAGGAPTVPSTAPPGGPVEVVLEERGSFAHATCAVCGWSGPGRRSRATARDDAGAHVAACTGMPPSTQAVPGA